MWFPCHWCLFVIAEHTRITDGPEDYEVAVGSTATFRCNAVSDASLPLTIEWLNNGELIDFEAEPRFVRSSDSSLTITKTTELDSRTYTCVARTDLDSASAQATLTVQGAVSIYIWTVVFIMIIKNLSAIKMLRITIISKLKLKRTERNQAVLLLAMYYAFVVESVCSSCGVSSGHWNSSKEVLTKKLTLCFL